LDGREEGRGRVPVTQGVKSAFITALDRVRQLNFATRNIFLVSDAIKKKFPEKCVQCQRTHKMREIHFFA
jgi:hypothetical protein